MKSCRAALLVLIVVGALLIVQAFAADKKCDPNYDNFGKAFLGKYCTGCHASTLAGFARKGAPAGLNFETIDGAKKFAAKILKEAGGGKMPPAPPKPTADEKTKLKAWLDCDK